MWPYVRHAYRHVEAQKRYLMCVEGTRVMVGAWLRDHTLPESKIRAAAIGHVGYASNRYIIDSAGLVTPPDLQAVLRADYHVAAYPVESESCGPVKTFETGWPTYPQIIISRCSEVKGFFGTLALAETRITYWIKHENGDWHKEMQPHLETQWFVHTERPSQDWTLYVHFTRADGTRLAQADHLLGLQPDGSIIPTAHWPAGKRVYDYVPLPEELLNTTQALDVRVGVWDPVTGERLEAQPVHAQTDEYGRLVIRLQ